LRIYGYPFQERSDFGVNAGYAGLAAANAPRHYADVGPLAVLSLRQQRTARIALYTYESVKCVDAFYNILSWFAYQTTVFATLVGRSAQVCLENRLRKSRHALVVFPYRYRHFQQNIAELTTKNRLTPTCGVRKP
jgi:hypothetical protein